MNIAKKLWFLNSASADAGYTYLTQNAKIFYDFTTLTGADGSAITTVQDLSANNIDASNASPAQAPTLVYSQFGDNMIRVFKAFPTVGSKDVLISDTYFQNQITSDFEILCTSAQASEADRDWFGVATGTNVFRVNITANKIRIEYRYSAATARRFVIETTSTVYTASTNTGLRLYRFKFDFINDVFKFWIDGVEQAMTNLVDAFSLIDPTKWANSTNKLCIGGYNNGGTIGTMTAYHLMKNWVCTPILTDQQVLDVSNYLMNEGTTV